MHKYFVYGLYKKYQSPCNWNTRRQRTSYFFLTLNITILNGQPGSNFEFWITALSVGSTVNCNNYILISQKKRYYFKTAFMQWYPPYSTNGCPKIISLSSSVSRWWMSLKFCEKKIVYCKKLHQNCNQGLQHRLHSENFVYLVRPCTRELDVHRQGAKNYYQRQR